MMWGGCFSDENGFDDGSWHLLFTVHQTLHWPFTQISFNLHNPSFSSLYRWPNSSLMENNELDQNWRLMEPVFDPLQCSCLENPMDREAWWAAVHGVTKSWTRLQWLSTAHTQHSLAGALQQILLRSSKCSCSLLVNWVLARRISLIN